MRERSKDSACDGERERERERGEGWRDWGQAVAADGCVTTFSHVVLDQEL